MCFSAAASSENDQRQHELASIHRADLLDHAVEGRRHATAIDGMAHAPWTSVIAWPVLR